MKGFLVRQALKKYQPRLVVVFGEHGTVEARSAIAAVLASHRATVSASAGELEREVGTTYSAWQLFMLWARQGSFPEVCVVDAAPEEAAYADLKKRLPIACGVAMPTGDIAAATNVFAGSPDAARAACAELKEMECAVLVADDKALAECAQDLRTSLLRIGFSKEADVRIDGISYTALPQKRIAAGGMSVRLKYGDDEALVHVRDTFGKRSAYGIVAALAVALHFDIDVERATDDLHTYNVPNSSFRLCEGVKRTALFVHSTQVTPQSAREAIRILGALRAAGQLRRTIIVLGDVLDPHGDEERLHRALGELAARHANLLYLGGERVIFTEEGARKAGMLPDNIARFNEPAEAARAAQEEMNAYDGVLVLGDERGSIAQAVAELQSVDATGKT